MKNKVLLTIVFSLFLSACAQTVHLNRAEGVRGRHAPVLTKSGVLFSLVAPGASLVTLVGNFNGWDPQSTPLNKDTSGIWKIVLKLNKGGKYYYKYVVDGYWVADPDNPDVENNGYGSVNSFFLFK